MEVMNLPLRTYGPGGVAERLIAPVLKTGRPKGLVSSNLTPSAFQFSISDTESLRVLAITVGVADFQFGSKPA